MPVLDTNNTLGCCKNGLSGPGLIQLISKIANANSIFSAKRKQRGCFCNKRDEAIIIDTGVDRLSIRDLEIGVALTLNYFNGSNISQVTWVLRIGRNRANVLVQAGTVG